MSKREINEEYLIKYINIAIEKYSVLELTKKEILSKYFPIEDIYEYNFNFRNNTIEYMPKGLKNEDL